MKRKQLDILPSRIIRKDIGKRNGKDITTEFILVPTTEDIYNNICNTLLHRLTLDPMEDYKELREIAKSIYTLPTEKVMFKDLIVCSKNNFKDENPNFRILDMIHSLYDSVDNFRVRAGYKAEDNSCYIADDGTVMIAEMYGNEKRMAYHVGTIGNPKFFIIYKREVY